MRPVSLREYVERVLDEMDRRYQQRFEAQQEALEAALLAAKEAVTAALAAAKEAVIKAETATENRLTLLNELRSGVATTDQVEVLTSRIVELKERFDKIEGRSSGLTAGWGYLLGTVGLAAAVVGIVVGTR